MPSSKNYKRDLKQEAKTDKARGGPAARKRRVADRRKMEKKVGKAALKGKDVDHSGRKATGSTKVKSVKANRAHGGRIGNRAGKAAGGRKGMRSRWGGSSKNPDQRNKR